MPNTNTATAVGAKVASAKFALDELGRALEQCPRGSWMLHQGHVERLARVIKDIDYVTTFIVREDAQMEQPHYGYGDGRLTAEELDQANISRAEELAWGHGRP